MLSSVLSLLYQLRLTTQSQIRVKLSSQKGQQLSKKEMVQMQKKSNKYQKLLLIRGLSERSLNRVCTKTSRC